MNKFIIRQSVILLITASIWGVAFVAQSVGMEYIGPFTFNAVRFLLGGLVLLPFIFFRQQQAGEKNRKQETAERGNRLLVWKSGLLCGVILCTASSLQQIGMKYTSVGKAGFITAMYIVIVPVLGIFLKKIPGIRLWAGVLIAMAGLYLLCMKESFSLSRGDLIELLCAIVFSFHILVIDAVSDKVDGVKLSCIQFFVSSVISAVFMFALEQPQIRMILSAWKPILYTGILSCGVAYTFQIIGQRGMNPTIASMIMSLESVISVIAGFFILGQVMSSRELAGCALMFFAIVLVQLPERKGKQEKAGHLKKSAEPAETV